ncbi:MAG: choice-of-anchor M domain-containing protein, partial [Microbacteriaceae bacterium]|nr:choice-of-anchor M domain-containing protein [Microbacteriaceae bacterium]
GIMHFLAYESKNDKRVPIWNQFYSVAGTQDFSIEHPGIYIEGAYIVAQFVPHGSAKNLQSSKQVEVADGYALDKKYQAQGVAKVVPGSADQGATQPTQPGANQPTQPVKPAPADPTQPVANPWGDRLLIKDGHLDIAAKMDADALQITLIDDSNTEGQGRKERALNTVAIAVNDAARLSERQKNAISREAYKHILNFDSNDNWLLPLSQKQGLPWPGYSTEHVAAGKVAGDFTLELTKVSGPGKVTLYQTDGFGGNPEVLLSGDKRSLTVPQNTHAHAAWAFTAPGVYELTLQYRAQGAAGNQLQTEEQTLMFVVGDKALAGDASSNSNGNVTVPTPVPNPGIALPPGGIINDVSRGDQPAPTQTAPAPYTGDLKHKGEGVTAPEKPTVEVPATEQPAPAPQGGKSEDAKGQKLPDTGTDASALLAAAAILTAAGAATLVARRRKA